MEKYFNLLLTTIILIFCFSFQEQLNTISIYNYNLSYYDVYINNALIIGTFNYCDSSYSQVLHFTHDVLPYLIWGNNQYDDSIFIERFAWEKNSGTVGFLSGYEWMLLRGDTLINLFHSANNNSLSLYEEGILSGVLL